MNTEFDADAAAEGAAHDYAMDCMEEKIESLRKDAARWDWIMQNYYGGDLGRTQKVIGQCFSREQMEAAIDKDLEEGK